MSFSTKNGDPIAIVKGGKSNGEIIFVNNTTNTNSVIRDVPVKKIELFDGKFEQLPSKDVRVLYIAGPSGSGKSTYAAFYIKKYLKLYPKEKFYLFSRVDSDKVLDELKPIRIKTDASIIADPFNINEIEPNSIVLFDDIDCISDKKIQAVVNNLKEQILDLGRHTNIQCVITSHLINGSDRNATRTTLNEMQSFTFFPKSGSVYQINYALKHYFGISGTQIKKLLALDTRWITIIKSYPQVIISEHLLAFISSF